MSTVPPAVRWARELDGGVYVFAPDADRWYVVYPWGNLGASIEAPPGAEVLAPLGDAAREINDIRDALLAALGGPDSVPAGATPLEMIDALVQLNRYYHHGWGESHARLKQAKRTLAEHGITAYSE